MTTRDALYRAIIDNPWDVTARLAFADYLDETGGPGDAVLAEFIRVQCRLSTPPWNSRDLIRSEAILCDHETCWRRGPKCWRCGGTGSIASAEVVWNPDAQGYRVEARSNPPAFKCPDCHGGYTGSLVERTMRDNPDDKGGYEDWLISCDFVNGFPGRVRCTLEQWTRKVAVPCGIGHVEIPWAANLVREWPVTEVVLTDREPERCQSMWLYARGIDHPSYDWNSASAGTRNARLPPGLFLRLWKVAAKKYVERPPSDDPIFAEFPTSGDALAALSAAALAWAREEAGLPKLGEI